MDRMNRCFQELLEQKKFAMKAYEQEEEWLYRGNLELSEIHIVPFSVSISKGERYAFAQITYQKIAYLKEEEQLPDWHKCLNQLNQERGVYYYFCLDAKGDVFARYVTQVSEDWEQFFNILVQGAKLVKEVVRTVEKQFGPFVSL